MTPVEEQQLSQEIRDSGRAKEVLGNEAFKDAVNRVEEALLAGMRKAPIADDKLRLRLLDKYECLHAVVEELQTVVNTGDLAQEQIKQEGLLARAKEFLGMN